MYGTWAKVLIITFLLVTTTLVVSTEWMLRTQVAPADVEKQHAAFFRASTAPNAAFGDSLTTYGFTGGDQIANYANFGESYIITAEKIRYHYKNISPGLVILQADPMQFSIARYDSDANNEKRRNLAFAREEPKFLITVPEYRGSLSSLWWTFIRKGKVESLVQLNKDGSRSRADRFDEYSPATRIRQTHDFINTLRPATDSLETNRNWNAFKAVVQYLVDLGARVCLVHFPVSIEFQNLAKNEPFYIQTKTAIRKFADEKSLPYIDASKWLDGPEMYADPYHLSYLGAPLFSARVIPECLNATGNRK